MKLDRDRALDHAHELVAKTWQQFDAAREYQPGVTEDLIALLSEPLPQQGVDAIQALDEADRMLDTTLSQARPRYFGYIGSSGLEIGALADLLAGSHDANLAINAGAATLIEEQAWRWVAEFVGYPAQGGSFTSGGTVSNITALMAARERAIPGARERGIAPGSATVYCSSDAHYSIRRAIEVLGIGSDWLRSVPVTTERIMDVSELSGLLEEDIEAGRTPIAVIATAGTTLTGAIDPLEQIAVICERHGVWLHVDGAYGLPAAAVNPAAFAGLERADSITIDAHKWMFVPKACGVVLVKDPQTLASAFGHATSYIPDSELNAVDVTLEYSRPLRALKIWLAFRVHGADAFRKALRHNIDQAQLLYDLAIERAGWEVALHPQLSIVLLRHVGVDNAELVRAIQDDGRVYVSHADLDGHTWLRPCFTNPRTREDDVRKLIDVADEIVHRNTL